MRVLTRRKNSFIYFAVCCINLHFLSLDGFAHSIKYFQNLEYYEKNRLKAAQYLTKHPIEELRTNNELKIFNLWTLIDHHIIPIELFFDTQSELIISFSPKDFHASLIVDNLEFHGSFYPQKSFTRFLETSFFKAKIFIKIKGVKEKEIHELKRTIQSSVGLEFKTCLAAIYYVLEKGAGITPPTRSDFSISKLLRKSLQKGFKDSNNNPLNTELYLVENVEYKQIIKQAKKQERRLLFTAASSFLMYFIKKKASINKL